MRKTQIYTFFYIKECKRFIEVTPKKSVALKMSIIWNRLREGNLITTALVIIHCSNQGFQPEEYFLPSQAVKDSNPSKPHCSVLFHFSDKKSERAKDIHLFKRLTTLLRSREVEPGKRQALRLDDSGVNLCIPVCCHSSFLSDILESEAKSVLLDIKHPAIKKQVWPKIQYKWPYSNREAHYL